MKNLSLASWCMFYLWEKESIDDVLVLCASSAQKCQRFIDAWERRMKKAWVIKLGGIALRICWCMMMSWSTPPPTPKTNGEWYSSLWEPTLKSISKDGRNQSLYRVHIESPIPHMIAVGFKSHCLQFDRKIHHALHPGISRLIVCQTFSISGRTLQYWCHCPWCKDMGTWSWLLCQLSGL